MADEKPNSIDDFERFIETKIALWSPDQRIALAVAMAERWLPIYEAFSAREQWGDPAHMRHSLDAVWNHLQGKTLSPDDVKRYVTQVEDSTPHMDDFDDLAALAAGFMVSQALECCKTDDNAASTMQAVISGFEAIVPDWDMDPEEQPRLWRKIRVQREFKKQEKLVDEIEAITHFDGATIQSLRKKLTSKEYIGEAMPVAKTAAGPFTMTNQTAFEIYRRLLEHDLKDKKGDWWENKGYEPGSYMWAIMLFAEWSSRYTRRGAMINPGFGSSKLADVTAQQALMARWRARDRIETTIPDWGDDLNNLVRMALKNTPIGFDVTAIDQPHGYGPSMRMLWIEAQRLDPTAEVWRDIITWGRHRPAAWEKEDRRKKRGQAHTTPQLGALLARELSWDTMDDLEYPWTTDVDGERWQIRLNDFPDDFMYTLMIDGEDRGDFHDWPATWRRGHDNLT